MENRKAHKTAPKKLGRSAFGLTPSGRGWFKHIPGLGTRWVCSFIAAPTATEADAIFAEKYPGMTATPLAAWTINALADDYIESRRRLGRDPKTIRGYIRSLDLLAGAIGGAVEAGVLGPADFHAVIESMRGLAPVTRVNHIVNIRSMFRWAEECGYVNPVQFGPDFSPPNAAEIRRSRQKRLYTPGQVRRLYSASSGVLRVFVLLGINGGMGGKDIAHLTGDDVVTDWIETVRHKTGVDRLVPLWPETKRAIEAIELPIRTSKGLPVVRHDHDQLSIWFRELCEHACVPCLGFYTLRRTFRTIADETMDQRAIALVMGHAAARSDVAALYVQAVGRSRLRAVVDHVRRRVLPSPAIEAVPSD